jgi:hypothetical protein
MAAGTWGPSFEARREERRAPQDDGNVVGAMDTRVKPAYDDYKQKWPGFLPAIFIL